MAGVSVSGTNGSGDSISNIGDDEMSSGDRDNTGKMSNLLARFKQNRCSEKFLLLHLSNVFTKLLLTELLISI